VPSKRNPLEPVKFVVIPKNGGPRHIAELAFRKKPGKYILSLFKDGEPRTLVSRQPAQGGGYLKTATMWAEKHGYTILAESSVKGGRGNEKAPTMEAPRRNKKRA
jgi:hypothetical protein